MGFIVILAGVAVGMTRPSWHHDDPDDKPASVVRFSRLPAGVQRDCFVPRALAGDACRGAG